jgi:3' exoribonuclease, RNase T-like
VTAIAYDCEFLEDGRTIELISIGMVAEDGREYYAVCSDAPWDRIRQSDWLVRNVLPSLPVTCRKTLDTYLAHPEGVWPYPSLDPVGIDLRNSLVKPRQVIANEVRDFILAAPDPELWAWYAAYDHVVLCQLWGPMIALPEGIPMFTSDLRQECERLGNPELPSMPDLTEHNALSDAREVMYRKRYLAELSPAAVQ